ncbi:MAG: hypothetical protein GPJ54_11095 [Candidatus Heimdallarchaeota archaeon]|nr:hypothetical protein [Candidatus Heimdallarchaeota archaeon]
MIKVKHLVAYLYLLLILPFIGFLPNTNVNSPNIVLNDINNQDITGLDTSELNFSNRLVQSTSIDYNETSPISIFGNAGFNGYPGAGTVEDPYRIEGWNITGSGNLIHVSGTTAHFSVRNNYLNGRNSNDYGIWITNLVNGTISNNIITGVGAGIKFWEAHHINISHNQIYNNNRQGILVQMSDYNDLWNNSVSNNQEGGIVIWNEGVFNNVHNNSIFNNTGGIEIHSSFIDLISNTTVSHNLVYENSQNGIAITAMNSTIINNTISNNNGSGITQNGNNSNIIKNTVSNNKGSGIAPDGNNTKIISNFVNDNNYEGVVINGNNNTVKNNLIYNNDWEGLGINGNENDVSNNIIHDSITSLGIRIWSGIKNSIINNTIFNTEGSGIGLSESTSFAFINANTIYGSQSGGGIGIDGNNHNISNNEIFNHKEGPGIIVWGGENHYITRNTIYANTESGITLHANNNIITLNDFHQETIQIIDQGTANLIHYNYYHDWSDTPTYFISGSANNQDISPQDNPNHMSSLSMTIDDGGTSDLTGNVGITWNAIDDSFDHPITYSVSYSSDSGTSWTFLESGLNTLNYELDTTAIFEGSAILLRIEAIDEIGFTSTVISTGSYNIDNFDDPTSSSTIATSTIIHTSSDKTSEGASFVNHQFLYLTLLPFGALYVIILKKKRSG